MRPVASQAASAAVPTTPGAVGRAHKPRLDAATMRRQRILAGAMFAQDMPLADVADALGDALGDAPAGHRPAFTSPEHAVTL